MRYFQHLGTMRHDPKIRRVFERYGIEGYGLYCLIIESITEAIEDYSPLPTLEETCEDIAQFYNGNTSRVEQMIHFMCNQDLLTLEQSGEISCHKIYKFLLTSATRSKKLQKLIKVYKAQVAEQKKIGRLATPNWFDAYEAVYDMSVTVNDESQTVTARLEEKRQEEPKLEENEDLKQKKLDFEKWWEHYPRKCDKNETLALFLNIHNLPVLEDHIALVSDWMTTEEWQKDNRKFIPNAISWLRSEKWKERPHTDPNLPNRSQKFSSSFHSSDKENLAKRSRGEFPFNESNLKELNERVPWKSE